MCMDELSDWVLPIVCPGGLRGGENRSIEDRLTDSCEPPCPVIRVLWLGIGVEQAFTAERTLSTLASHHSDAPIAEWRPVLPPPLCPVFGKLRIIRGGIPVDHHVPDERCPGELYEIATRITVTEDPLCPPGGSERAEVAIADPLLRFVRVSANRPAKDRPPKVVVDITEDPL